MDEITLLDTNPDKHGLLTRRVLYWYDLSANPVKDSKGNTIKLVPSTDVPNEAVKYIPSDDRMALNNGLAGFEIIRREQTAGEGTAAFQVRMLLDHDARQTWWIQDKRDKFAQSGRSATG